MKLSETINFVPFYDKIRSQSMPIITAYKLAKIYAKAKEDEAFYQEKLRELLFKYGETDESGNVIPTEDGKGVKLKADCQEECVRAITELQEIESDMKFEPLDIGLFDGMELSPSDIEGIIQFLA